MSRHKLPFIAMAGIAFGLSVSSASAVPIVMPTDSGSVVIDSTHFANTVIDSSLSETSLVFGPGTAFTFGPFTTAESIPWVTGSDLTVGLALGEGPTGGVADFIVPAFSLASIVNGAGADFAVWEAGDPSEPFLMSVSTDGGASFSANLAYDTAVTNPLATTPPFNVNIAFVNLDDFGLAPGAAVDAIKLSGVFTGIGGSGPDLLALAALNAGPPTGNIPEPGTLLLLGLGLVGIGLGRRRQHS
jgi:hypothetical protein